MADQISRREALRLMVMRAAGAGIVLQVATAQSQTVVSREADGTIHAITPNGLGPNTQIDFSLSPDGTAFIEKSNVPPNNVILTTGSVRTLPDGGHQAVVEKINFSSRKDNGKFSPDGSIDAFSTQLSAQDEKSIANARASANSSLQSIADSPYSPWAQQAAAPAQPAAQQQQAPASDAKVEWQGDKAIVNVTATDPKTGQPAPWTVVFDRDNDRHVFIEAKNNKTNSAMQFSYTADGKLFMLESRPIGDYWRAGNSTYYLNGKPNPNPQPMQVPDNFLAHIQPSVAAVLAAQGGFSNKPTLNRQGRPIPGSAELEEVMGRYHGFNDLVLPGTTGGGAPQPGRRQQIIQQPNKFDFH